MALVQFLNTILPTSACRTTMTLNENKVWQDYAAATVAATGKALLERHVWEDGDAAVLISRKNLLREEDAIPMTQAGSWLAVVNIGKQTSKTWVVKRRASTAVSADCTLCENDLFPKLTTC